MSFIVCWYTLLQYLIPQYVLCLKYNKKEAIAKLDKRLLNYRAGLERKTDGSGCNAFGEISAYSAVEGFIFIIV